MCEPVTAALMAAQFAMAAYGQYQQGRAQEAQQNYIAAQNQENAKAAEWQAQDAEARGEQEQFRQRLQQSQLEGQQISALASNGGAIGIGSSGDLLSDSYIMGQYDNNTIGNNADKEAYGYRVQSANYTNEAQLNRMAGKNAKKAGIMNAGTTLLSGASQFGSTFQFDNGSLAYR